VKATEPLNLFVHNKKVKATIFLYPLVLSVGKKTDKQTNK
jgi:hypothetical protein